MCSRDDEIEFGILSVLCYEKDEEKNNMSYCVQVGEKSKKKIDGTYYVGTKK